MNASARRIALLALLVAVAGCSQQPVDKQSDVITYLKEAKPVPVQTAQISAVSALLEEEFTSGELSALGQNKVYTKTFTAVDIYDAPFVHINITSPKKIGNIWQFAKKLKGDEWPKGEPSAWGVTITGATEARAPVSQIEYGLDTLQDIYKTVKAMGGPGKFEKIVAPLSAVFWLEHKDGSLWSIYTHEKVSDEEYERGKAMYDEILAGLDISESDEIMEAAWTTEPALSTASSSSDGSFDLTTLASTEEIADIADTFRDELIYKHRGSWTNPEATQRTLIGKGGFAQGVEYYDRPGERWRVGSCLGFGRPTDSEVIGCGPAAFSAMLTYHFKYRGAKVNGSKLGDPVEYMTFPAIPSLGIPSRTVKISDGTYKSFKRFVSAPVGSRDYPRIIDYMGSCFVSGEVATSGGAFSNGGTAFLAKHVPDLKLAYNWSRGFSNPGSVRGKVDRLRYARDANRPAVVLYPTGTLAFHFSFVKAWKAKRLDYGLFIQPENDTHQWVNMGDTFRGEVGVWSIY